MLSIPARAAIRRRRRNFRIKFCRGFSRKALPPASCTRTSDFASKKRRHCRYRCKWAARCAMCGDWRIARADRNPISPRSCAASRMRSGSKSRREAERVRERQMSEYEIYAVRYAHHDRRASENFLGGDPHDGPMPLDYFVWAVKGEGKTYVIDTGFGAEQARQRKRALLRSPA